MKTNLCLFALLIPFFTGCGMARTDAETAVKNPVRQRVQRQAMRAAVWRFVYCLDDPAQGQEVVELLHEIAAAQPFGKRISVHNCQELTADTLGSGPVAVFGDRLPAGADNLPLVRDEAKWTFANNHEFGGGDVLLLPHYRNPWSTGNTTTSFFLSEAPRQLVDRLRQEFSEEWGRMFWRNWAYELHRTNGDRVYGSYGDTTWAFDRAAEIVLKSPDKPVYDIDGLKVFSYDGVVPPPEVDRIAGVLEDVSNTVDSLSGRASGDYPEVRLYPSLERIGLRRGQMRPVQYEAKKNILHLVPSFVSTSALRGDVEVWLPCAENRERVLELQVRAAAIPRFAQAFAAEFRAGQALAGMAPLPATEGEYLSPLLQAALDRAQVFRQAGITDLPSPTRAPVTEKSFLGGMTFAHEGYRIHNGYGGEKIKPSLDSLAELHVNALAVVPYTFMRNPDKPTRLFIPQDAGSENDWATACSLREAHEKGWFTLLKPQIWLGGGHWPGDVALATDADWATWFAGYRYWILHYALLAEREGVDALCLGTELVQTTRQHPDRWRAIIADVRKVYRGQLTYAANWGEEFEHFSFWEDLDAIGLNSYYPLSEAEQPEQGALNAGARKWMQMAADVSQRTGKPLWLTEVGFRSVERAWQNPHAEAGERPANDAHQAACYEALVTAARETPELKGMFIWKWPSYLGYENGRPNTSKRFTPGSKPAAQKLGDFYRERTR